MPHARRLPLIALLSRLRWQRDADLWTVRCSDDQGRHAQVRVEIRALGVVLVPSRPGALTFTPLAVGRLRAALRDAVVAHAVLAGSTTKDIDHDHDLDHPTIGVADAHAA
ncbi:MAG TPA: hypothetical protein VM677_01355 [Actinokineospora sp.]|jgi:hypothetical protein|nr:hypothetical protein [Actinokineospora sp.]